MPQPASQNQRVAEWLGHIRALAEGIGPRGPTREGERRGSEYARSTLAGIGLQPVTEGFRSARSIFHPHLLGSIGMIAAFAVFPLGGTVTAAIAFLLSVLVIVSELQELGFRANILRLLMPKADSQNVHAVISPRGEHTRDLLLIGHVDTQRTPLIFRTPGWVKVYDKFTTAAIVTFVWQAALSLLSIPFAWTWAWYACIPTAACAILLAALCIEAECTPFTAGANDNASAVGLVLTLARQLAAHPLEHTRVYAVVTGCEEVQHYGMIDFYRRHRSEMKNPRAMVFEMLGCAGPSWLTREGIIVPFQSDPGLTRMIEKLAADHPEWKAYPSKISGGNTELADAVRNKVPAITLMGLGRDKVAPFWHQKQDTFDKIDPDVLSRTWELAGALVREIDQG